MNIFIETIDNVTSELDQLHVLMKKSKARQIKGRKELESSKRTSLAWFNGHRQIVSSFLSEPSIQHIDKHFEALMKSADIFPVRKKSIALLKITKRDLYKIRSENITSIAKSMTGG